MPRARAQHETQFFPVIVSILQKTGREDNAGRSFKGSLGAADSSPVLFSERFLGQADVQFRIYSPKFSIILLDADSA